MAGIMPDQLAHAVNKKKMCRESCKGNTVAHLCVRWHCRKKELQLMKKGAFLINYARGDVVEKQVNGHTLHLHSNSSCCPPTITVSICVYITPCTVTSL